MTVCRAYTWHPSSGCAMSVRKMVTRITFKSITKNVEGLWMAMPKRAKIGEGMAVCKAHKEYSSNLIPFLLHDALP